MPVPSYGDAEAAARAILSADADLVAAGATASVNLVGYQLGDTWLRVFRNGGEPTHWRRLDNPIINVEVYAPDKGAAADAAQLARAALFGARGYAGHGLKVCDIDDVEGIAWSPDDRQDQHARYTFSVRLITKPSP